MRFQHRRADKIFTGDQFDVFLLAHALVLDGISHDGIHTAQTQWRRSQAQFEFADAALVASALEFRVEEGVEDFFSRLHRRGFAGEAEHIDAVVLAHQCRGLHIGNKRGAHPGHLVGSDAHADAARADQQAEFRAACGHRLRRRPGEVRVVIARLLGFRAKIRDAQAALLQVLLQRFLQFVATVVRAQRKRHRRSCFRCCTG